MQGFAGRQQVWRCPVATGEITHIEFPADDVDRAKRFYEAVVGWQFSEMEGFPGYWLFRTGEGSGGGLGKRGESVGSVIRDYITVAKLEDAVAAAEKFGGKVVTPPRDIPGQGRYAAVLTLGRFRLNRALPFFRTSAKAEATTLKGDDIASLRESPVSLMPEGLLTPLKPQELRDLFAYIQAPAKP